MNPQLAQELNELYRFIQAFYAKYDRVGDCHNPSEILAFKRAYIQFDISRSRGKMPQVAKAYPLSHN